METVTEKKVEKAIILGSGLTAFDGIKPEESVKYSDIPGWPLGTVKGHKGVLDKYKDVWVLRGRAHLYEGFTWEEVCFPTKFLADNGIKELIITNAAGGINPSFEVGDLMQITGYLNFMEPYKERGNIEQILTEPKKIQVPALLEGVHHGTYVGVHGPNYESNAEVAMFRKMGGDAVGMSTIPELETAEKHGMAITAVSIITNVYGKTDDLGHDGVVKAAKEASSKLFELLDIG